MRLSKLHGLGNDFLVALLEGEPADLDVLARTWCDRRTGIGADGFIVGCPPAADSGADLRMILHNADGSRAEMSGNGIRCLAHAAARAAGRGAVTLVIDTDGGRRIVTVDGDGERVSASVDMGEVGEGPVVPEALASSLDGVRFATADVGNPHLVVCVEDLVAVDVAEVGSRYEGYFPEGMNVEFIAPSGDEGGTLDLRVWERGVGVTQACGTGAVAGATRAVGWGMVDSPVRVRMPGGDVQVEVGATAVLVGPSVFVADIEWSGPR